MADLDFSLIMATLNREREVEAFLDSAAAQSLPRERFEVIVADQNDSGIDLTGLLARYRGRLNIVHLHPERRGASHARNAGIAAARGAVLAFPDDDCCYYPDTLANVARYFQAHPGMDIVHGRIVDRARGRNVMRAWPGREVVVSVHNAYFFASCITLFARRSDAIVFDEAFGPGTPFGGYEDVELTLRNVRAGRSVRYTPAIEVTHPDLHHGVMPLSKVAAYGMGFGALCRKHWCGPVAWLFTKAVGFHLLRALGAALRLRGADAVKGLHGASSRVRGLLLFSGHDNQGST